MTADLVEAGPAPRRIIRMPADRAGWLRERGVYVAIVVLVLFNLAFTPHYTLGNAAQLLSKQLPTVLIVALGMALVIGTGGIDLSVGATMALASAVVAKVVAPASAHGFHQAFAVAVIAALAAGALMGLINGFSVAVLHVQPIVATLSLLVGVRGIALVLTGGGLVELFVPQFKTLRAGTLLGVQYMMIIAFVLAIIVAVLVRRTTFGYRLLAIGGNLRASVLAGLPVRRTLFTVYAISGILAAISGVLLTAQIRASDPSYLGVLYELDAITAVVVGGTPLTGGKVRVLGTVAGATLMLMLTTTLTAHNQPHSVAQVVEAVIIVLAVYIQRSKRSSE